MRELGAGWIEIVRVGHADPLLRGNGNLHGKFALGTKPVDNIGDQLLGLWLVAVFGVELVPLACEVRIERLRERKHVH